jgi:NADH-quinone oxidoreductase subunit M
MILLNLYLMYIVLFSIIFFIFIINLKNLYKYKNIYLFFSILIFIFSLIILFLNNINNINPNIMVKFDSESLFLYFLYQEFYIDNLSISFIVLTTFLIPITLIIGLTNIKYRLKEYLICFFIIELLLINFFLVTNLLLFYIYFEAILIPMFLIIIIWGSRKRKIHASYMFFFFTLVGSLFMLMGILWLYLYVGELNIQILQYIMLSKEQQLVLWFLFFISFAVKVPIYPVHTWLPEAHVEAPTGGSIILAGVLLKLGLYGILRILMTLFPIGNIYYSPVVMTLSFISIIFISIIILQQIDLKKIIAYSSVAHMNFAILGLFSNNIYGIEGSIYTMLSHGLISSMLFFCIGILYDRYGERNILYYSSITQIMPLFSFFFFIAMTANMGIPGMSSFVGEFLLLLSLSYKSVVLLFIISLSLFLTTVYCIWLYNRICFGIFKYNYIRKYKDITKIEFIVLLLFTLLIIFFGIYPNCILNLFHNLIYYNIFKYVLFITNNI